MLNICHMYPDVLNLYGDRGNVLAFSARCRWRNIPVTIHNLHLGEKIDFTKMDFLFLGGGSDREQNLMTGDLTNRTDNLREAIEDGLVVLAICGGYQLLGHYYRTKDGQNIPCLGLLDFYTEAKQGRLLGNIATEVKLEDVSFMVTGFENHSGRTYLGQIAPLGRILAGHGNNGEDGLEGARYKNVFCSYLHGPLLPKNPGLADHLIQTSLKRRGFPHILEPLDDSMEIAANNTMLNRLGIKI